MRGMLENFAIKRAWAKKGKKHTRSVAAGVALQSSVDGRKRNFRRRTKKFRLSIAQDILKKSTDFLRKIMAPVSDAGS